jgi:hypothetical protein
MSVEACEYEGRVDEIIEYQAGLISEPGRYSFSEYNDLLCARGFTGPRCGVCEDGYGQLEAGECQ